MNQDCVICFNETESVENPLCKGNIIFDTVCNCKYFVHKECIEKWNKIKSTGHLCIICNSPMKAITQDNIIEIENSNEIVETRPVEPYFITRNIQYNINNYDNDDNCSNDEIKKIFLLIICVVFGLFIIVSNYY
uniref:RING-CH-type domain-containing protein n=1 Tax=Florenciella sp. virus SA2 TaxID=3240092 RepID=A0AB39JCZ4_9VIRU